MWKSTGVCIITPRTKDAEQFYFGDEVEQNKDDVAKSRIPVIYLCPTDVKEGCALLSERVATAT